MTALAIFIFFALSARNVSYSTLSSKVPEPAERARFMSFQSAVQHVASALGASVSAQVLFVQPDGKLGNVPALGRMAIALTLLLPVLLYRVEREVRRRAPPRRPAPSRGEWQPPRKRFKSAARMFNLGAGEIAVIMIVALLLLGPDKLPELARGIGKFVREFRRQTDDVRGLVEREFYKMDQEVFAEEQAQAKRIEPPTPAEPVPPATVGPGRRAHPADLPVHLPPAGGSGRRAPQLGGAARRSEPPRPAPAEPGRRSCLRARGQRTPGGRSRRRMDEGTLQAEPLQARMSLAEHLGELRKRLLRRGHRGAGARRRGPGRSPGPSSAS